MNVNVEQLYDNDSKCYQAVREIRWSDGLSCPRCSSDNIRKNGHGNIEHRQRYLCNDCKKSFNDLTNTIFSGSRTELKTWLVCLHHFKEKKSVKEIAKQMDMTENDVYKMTLKIREGIVKEPDSMDWGW